MKIHLKTVGTTDTWITPKYITDALGEFDLDHCAHLEMPWQHAKNQYTIIEDGLKSEWFGRVWLNPPFDQYQIDYWFDKMAEHRNGLMLVSAAMETKRFKEYIFPNCSGVLFMDHRPYFRKPDGSKGVSNSGQTMCIVSFDEINLQSLINSNLGSVMVPLLVA